MQDALFVKKVIFILIFLYSPFVFSNIFKFLWGKPVKNSVFYLPVGTHTRHFGLTYFHLAGGSYKTFYLMTFINSFDDRVFSAGVERYIWQYHQLSVGYGAGLMYGYHGNLSTVHGIPLKDTFLFKYNINPVVVGIADITLTKRTQMTFVLAPLVVSIGIRFNFSE